MPPQNCFPKSVFKVVKDFMDLKDFKEKAPKKFPALFIVITHRSGDCPLSRTDYLMRS